MAGDTSGRYLRSLVRYQIEKHKAVFKRRFPLCQICGEMFDFSDLTLDHYPKKFCDIRAEFLTRHPRDSFATDQKFVETWRRFHLDQAQYRLACAACNRAID